MPIDWEAELSATSRPDKPPAINWDTELKAAEQQGPMPPPSFGEQFAARAAKPVTGYLPAVRQGASAGAQMFGTGVEQIGQALSGQGEDKTYPFFGGNPEAGGITVSPGLRGLGNVLAGAAGYVLSPVTGAVSSGVEEPVTALTGSEKAGQYAGFAATSAIPGMGLVKLPGAVEKVAAPITAAERIAQSGERLGVDVPRVIASDSKGVKTLAEATRGNERVETAVNEMVGKLGTKTEELAKGTTPEMAGETAKQGIVNWAKPKEGEGAKLVTDAYNKVDAAVDNTKLTKLTNAEQAIAEIDARRANAGLPPSPAGRFIREAAAKPSGPVERVVGDATGELVNRVQEPSGLNYKGVKDLRTYMGDLLDSPEQLAKLDFAAPEVKRLYGALSRDLEASVENAGGSKAKALWQQANNLSKMVADRREKLVRIVGLKSEATPAQVFDRLKAAASEKSRANSEALSLSREAIGATGWNEVAQGVTSRLGLTTKGEWDPTQFVRDWEKLTENGKNTLFAHDPAHRQALEDIYEISTRQARIKRYGNLTGAPRQQAHGVTTGLLRAPLKEIGGLVGFNQMSRILANPASTSSLAKLAKVSQAPATPASVAAAQRAARNFGATISSDLNIPNPANDLIGLFSGPRKSAASDRQQQPE